MTLADELTKLAGLRDSGVLTEDEFNEQKARLLAGETAADSPAASEGEAEGLPPEGGAQSTAGSQSEGALQTPAWAYVLLIFVAAFGMFVGGLMTHHHDVMSYDPNAQVGQLIGCAAEEGVNCDVVNTSIYSEVMGVPKGLVAIAQANIDKAEAPRCTSLLSFVCTRLLQGSRLMPEEHVAPPWRWRHATKQPSAYIADVASQMREAVAATTATDAMP